MAINAREFRQVMGRFATGVTVVTIAGEESLYGITVNSFTSVSLDPMLILICIEKAASGYNLFKPGRGFTVNILTEQQRNISARFADKDVQDKFADIDYTMGANGAPILNEVSAYLECRIARAYEGGDHTIFLAEVMDAQVCNQQRPLLFYAGQYNGLQR